MNDLSLLKSKLAKLRLRRSASAWVAALATVVAIALVGVVVAFFLDVGLHLGRIERMFVLAVWCALVIWTFYRFVLPRFRNRESLVELALLVEHQERISSELVAALQFSDSGRQQYGLTDLREGVIADTSDLSAELDYHQVKSDQSVGRRVAAAAGILLLAALITVVAGEHVHAFANRFLLGDAAFPTKTHIRIVSPGDRVAYGQAVVFKVEVDGDRPKHGHVRLVGSTSRDVAIVDLKPDASEPLLYTGQLRRALEDCTFVVEVGDARLGPIALTVMPLPNVIVALQIEAPAYAARQLAQTETSQRQNSALVGSRVTPLVTADKQLRSATIRINGDEFSMQKGKDGFTLESLPPALGHVEKTVRYEVDVVDADGLRLEHPISGTLRVREDRPPRVTSQTATQQILPDASPLVHFSASDDFGLQRIQLQRIVIGSGSTAKQVEQPLETVFESNDRPREVSRQMKLSFAELKLVKGDRVVCTFQAADYRGPDRMEITLSEPFVFEVTDRSTLLKSLSEADDKIDEDLESIIRAESGLGGRR